MLQNSILANIDAVDEITEAEFKHEIEELTDTHARYVLKSENL